MSFCVTNTRVSKISNIFDQDHCSVCEYRYLSQSLASVHISVRRFAN